MPSTTRWALPYPASTDPPAGHTELQNLATALDGVAMDDQGTLANRPTSTSGNPGKRGRYYMVVGDSTAANNGILWRDNGTGWDQVGGGTIFDTTANRPAANAVPKGTRFFSTDQIAEWVSDGANWIRLGAQPGDIIWTLEASARTGYLLLQGQAWPSTTGIYADLHTLWGGASLPDIRGRMPVALGTHTDVAALLNNEGVAVASRRPKHKHTIAPANARVYDVPGSANINSSAGDAAGADSSSAFLTVGPQTGAEPTDAPAFLVLQAQAKL